MTTWACVSGKNKHFKITYIDGALMQQRIALLHVSRITSAVSHYLTNFKNWTIAWVLYTLSKKSPGWRNPGYPLTTLPLLLAY